MITFIPFHIIFIKSIFIMFRLITENKKLWIIGSTVLRNYYLVFDNTENKPWEPRKIHFAKKNQGLIDIEEDEVE